MPHRARHTGARTRRLLVARPRLLAVLAIAIALVAPAPAFARTSASDVIAGVRLAADPKRASAAPDVDAAAGILVGPNGAELWSRGSRSRLPMASTTKLMTALLAIETGGLDKVVTISGAAANTEDGIGLKAGERITKRQLLELALVASSNDGAYALGEASAGDMGAFVKRMNERAAQLGMHDTHYVNPHGLDAPEHFSSPADLATLVRHLMTIPEFRRIIAMGSVAMPPMPGREPSLKATDELLGRYPGLAGGKTGFTGDAGYCFVATATRDGITLTSVILGSPSNDARFTQTAHLLDWGFAHLSRKRLTTKGEGVGTVAVARAASGARVPVRLASTTSEAVLDLAGALERRTSLAATIPLPVLEGQRVGEVSVVQNGRVLATVPVLASASVVSIDETLGAVPVSDYVDRSVAAVTHSSPEKPASFDPAKPVTRKIELRDGVSAPVAKGDALGEIVYTQDARVVARVPIVAAAGVERPTLLQTVGIMFTRGWLSVIGRPVTAARVLAAQQ